MFAKELVHGEHVRRFSVNYAGTEGWEVTVEEDCAVLSRLQYTDWHRVERALDSMRRETDRLRARGWRERPAH
ncbi:MAG TPA: hypothetical protein VF147_13370 [Vicinamibacterales bacterium]